MKTVLLVGDRASVRALRNQVNKNSEHWRATSSRVRLPFVDAVVAIGVPAPDALIAVWARRCRVPVGIIWTGADIALVDRRYNAAARVRARRYAHGGRSAFVRNELRMRGIDAAEVDVESAESLDAFFYTVVDNVTARKRRAVVSGSAQRVAAFVETAAAQLPDWEFHAAISGSRAERLEDILSLIGAERWYRLADKREDRLFRYAAALFRKRRFRPQQTASAFGNRFDEPQQESVVKSDLSFGARS